VRDDFDYFVSAAAPLSARTLRAVSEKLGVKVLQGYGLTETVNFSTTMSPDLSTETYRRFSLDAEIPSIGSSLYGNEVAVLNANGDYAASGEVGEICMRGHNVMLGYAGNEAATAEAFRFGWFHSQDLGYHAKDDESGQTFFVLTGRIKNIAKVRGESVSLEEMDRILCALPQIKDAACVAFPHHLLGEEIVAAIVCTQDVSDNELRALLRNTFSSTSLPERIIRLNAIPRTATGKVLRAQLKEELNTAVSQETQT
jgi:acyl-CoA synthetase (AMP-forming)/AMP-acid ligase II